MILLCITLLIAFIFALVVCDLLMQKTKDLKGKHVLITGGSSGIGLEAAKYVLSKGACVTLYARNLDGLNKAREELVNTFDGGNISVHIQQVDLTSSREVLRKNLETSEKKFGPVFLLINNAGFSRAAVFENLDEELVKDMFKTNVYGSLFLSQEVVKSMKSNNVNGFITFLSSQAGLFGFYGFSAYAACKGAVIRMAEALSMEMKPFGISVTVCLPPDTDTPGFHEEEKTKPIECKLISASAGVTEASVVAKALVEDTLKGRFYSTVGIEGHMLRILCGGMAPINSITDFFLQIPLIGVFKLVSGFYLMQFFNIVKNEYKRKTQNKKRE